MRNILLMIMFAAAFPFTGFGANKPEQAQSGNRFFITASFGTQMSGIKDEDFIAKNYAPLISLAAGKWFTPALALQLAYRGNYFNTIADDEKHHYNYLSGEAIFNLNSLLKPGTAPGNWHISLHTGAGYFYNHHYNQPNICALLGLSANIPLTQKLSTSILFSSIMGWDIYQGDEDILPDLSLGISYTF